MVSALDEVMWSARRALLSARRAGWAQPPAVAILEELAAAQARAVPPPPGALAAAIDAFELDPAEAATLALAASVELDARIGALFAVLQGVPEALRPTVGTLVELVGDRALGVFLPAGRLRRCGLIELEGDAPLVYRPVRCPDAVWTRLAGGAPPEPAPAVQVDELLLTPPLREAVLDAARWLDAARGRGMLVLWGPEGAGRHALAGAILAERGWRGLVRPADSLADAARCVELERDARWASLVPILVGDRSAPSEAARAWLAGAASPRIWIQSAVPDWLVELDAPTRVLHVPALDPERRHALWVRALAGVAGDAGDADAGELATRYRFGPGRIARVVELARADGRAVTAAGIRAACRATSRAGISLLAERLAPRSRDELVVTPAVGRDLELAVAWAASHARLYGAWGLATGVARARGITCLFSGAPGTGKTLAAQIMAGAIDRDLFRVDLSQAVSKWLGETEKNLGRLFDEAQDAGAVLFFDEADALFARRTEVRDAHDRYANLETGYLLQRLESHDGVVILATNRRQDLDGAFQRRFDVIIDFAAPGVGEREQLWRRHLPAAARCAADVDPARLAGLFELSGGQIRNAVITSVALTSGVRGAGDDGAVLSMPALVGGAARELVRAGRLVNPGEYGAWAATVRAALGAPPAEAEAVTRP